MPQMMPMNWMMMFITLMCIMLMTMTITFTIMKQLPQNNILKFNSFEQWTW